MVDRRRRRRGGRRRGRAPRARGRGWRGPVDDAAPLRARPSRTTGAAVRCASGRSSRSAGPPSAATIAAKRSAAAPLRSAGRGSASQARLSSSSDARERERHLDAAAGRRPPGPVSTSIALAHLERVARGRAEHAVHVGEQRDGRQAGGDRDVDQRARQRARVVQLRHERAGAVLDVEHERPQPGGELLGEDRGDDERHRLDAAGRVARRVQAAVGGREVVGLADDGAARVARRRARSRVGSGAVS